MTNTRIAKQHHATFESIRQVDTSGNEFWLARALSKVLDSFRIPPLFACGRARA
jgi:DNA-damage-inducible protein D